MAGAPGWPTLSQLTASRFDHLGQFSDWCDRVSGDAENALEALARQVRAPGGVHWEGQAAEAAISHAEIDVVRSRPLVWSLPEAAAIARRGHDILAGAHRLALDAVEDAERDGFRVGEDYSVADTQPAGTREQHAARQARARAHANYIRHRVGHLVAHDQHITGELTTVSAGWGTLTFEESGGAQPLDHRTVKDAPPPSSPPYPVNDVIAEATDLDGNHVILRRGYYDASTNQGWGWDKAYWKHGVVNPKVFTDLISHSRPVHQLDGTLRYDVPINRTHCTPGPLEIANCHDTGENLTMRIVVDPEVGRPDVPDGGQKGVITMFPLPGGSGVIELGPKGTWTPPWVNNNVPIN